ncbi:hypothetical protein N7466_011049 [Penicillium verhagenii]|uniref:uncharacterized protein n=1 Tax=Penicillium verhagenii TaxID=1562060 RepID=UPI00254518DA|nr:uncharacterized protein N7466_011049 [Penicillium verhagenii]KAJ5917495.1 hypothetical protein N7466_011049 [Penicillium verhagenii]
MPSNNSASLSNETLLDMLLPGFGPLSRLVSFYLQIDLSAYSFYIVTIAIFWTFAFILPKLFHQFQNLVLHYAASVDIMYQDPLYDLAMAWIAGHDQLNQTRCSIAGTKTSYNSPFRSLKFEEDKEEQEKGQLGDDSRPDASPNDQRFWHRLRYWNKRKPIQFTPKKDDFFFFWHCGRIFALCRKSFATSNNDSFYAFMENIAIYTAPWNQGLLKTLLEEIQMQSLQNKSSEINVFQGMKRQGSYKWVPMSSNVCRLMDSVVLDTEKKEVFEDAKKFLHPDTSQWYKNHNINYRRGYLFHGPPGTGKTSLCVAMATFLGLDIYTLSLNSLDEDGLALLLQDLPTRCVLLFEDIDSAGLRKRPNDVNANQVEISDEQLLSVHDDDYPLGQRLISLSALLNCIDGVCAKPGRILIMTTNHRDRLDQALTRPGRVDIEVEFELASTLSVQKLFFAFYTPCNPLGDSDQDQRTGNIHHETDILHSLSAEFARYVPGRRFSPAEIENYLLKYRTDPASAVAEVNEWIKPKLACE